MRVGRGLYVALEEAQLNITALHRPRNRVPQGVVCLLSALRFHD